MKQKIVIVLTGMLILLFMYTGCSKFFEMKDFIRTMRNQPLPPWLTLPLIGLIPVTQTLTAGCLITEKFRRAGLYSSLILLSLSTLYIAALLLHFFPWVPCSCGNAFRWLSWQQLLWLNLSFLLLTGLALRLMVTKRFSSPLNVFV